MDGVFCMQYGVQDERDSQRGHRFHPFGPVVTAAARATLLQPPSCAMSKSCAPCAVCSLRDAPVG